jgi:hypothetical protein
MPLTDFILAAEGSRQSRELTALCINITDSRENQMGAVEIARSMPFARPGGAVAMAKQTNDILSGLLVDQEGFLDVAFVVGTGAWQVARISGPSFPPGAGVAMAKQTNDILSGLLVDKEGFLNVAFVAGTGAWQVARAL